MSAINQIIVATLIGLIKDRILHAILGVAGLFLLLIPVFSQFSARQVRELAITLSLSASSFVLLVLAILIGASSLQRDVDRRYTAAVLGLPISRSAYILGRYIGTVLLLGICGASLALAGFLIILWHQGDMSSGVALNWVNIFIAFFADILKYFLLIAFSFLFSTFSTSLFLPVFGTLGIFLAGSASQQVIDYLATEPGMQLPTLVRFAAEAFYWVIPNFEIFNFKVPAIYGLEVSVESLIYAGLYFLFYTPVVLILSIIIFNRRELP
jgi:ABC-type transport system involved in multi-copper enzyme maturation permease subunit